MSGDYNCILQMKTCRPEMSKSHMRQGWGRICHSYDRVSLRMQLAMCIEPVAPSLRNHQQKHLAMGKGLYFQKCLVYCHLEKAESKSRCRWLPPGRGGEAKGSHTVRGGSRGWSQLQSVAAVAVLCPSVCQGGRAGEGKTEQKTAGV